jgi:hypothetical protein
MRRSGRNGPYGSPKGPTLTVFATLADYCLVAVKVPLACPP